jgi:hypothetical protein
MRQVCNKIVQETVQLGQQKRTKADEAAVETNTTISMTPANPRKRRGVPIKYYISSSEMALND